MQNKSRTQLCRSSLKLLIILILVTAGFLRFWNLNERGLIEWDEAYYTGVVKTIKAGFDWTIGKITFADKHESLKDALLKEGVAANFGGKHGFILIAFLASIILGFKNHLLLIVSALAGTATVYLTGKIAEKIFTEHKLQISLLSMLLLAVSSIHTYYSRSGFSTSLSVFFVYLGLFFYLNSIDYFLKNDIRHRKNIFVGGLSIGYSFTVHYNLYWVPIVFFMLLLTEILIKTTNNKLSAWVKRPILFGCGAAIPLFLFELGSFVLKIFIYSSESLKNGLHGGQFFTFVEEILFLRQNKTFFNKFSLFYVDLIKNWEGALALIISILALIWITNKIIRNFSLKQTSLISFIIIPFILWSIFNYPIARNIVVSIPALAVLISGFGYELYTKLFKKSTIMLTITLFIIIIGGILNNLQVLEMKSGMPKAIEFMQKQGSIKHVSSDFYTSRLFVGRENAVDTILPFSNTNAKKKLEELYAKGYKFILISGGNKFVSNPNLVRLLENANPIFSTPNPTHIILYDSFAHLDSETQKKILKEEEKVYVYLAEDIIKNTR